MFYGKLLLPNQRILIESISPFPRTTANNKLYFYLPAHYK